MFVSNTSRESRNSIFKKLKEKGFGIFEKDLFTSPEIAISYLKKNNLKSPFLLIHDNLKPSFQEFILTSQNPSDYDSVVLGNLNNTTTYSEINFAFRVLRNLQIQKKTPILVSMGNNKVGILYSNSILKIMIMNYLFLLEDSFKHFHILFQILIQKYLCI